MGKFTKEEVIGVLFAKLMPERKEVFADVGCGSGRVSAFFSPYVKKVYAVDANLNAFKESRKNLAAFENVEVLHMNGERFLKEYDCDVVFFGGTANIERMLEIACKKARKIAVNAARIEVACSVIEKMKTLGIFQEAIILNVSRSYELAGKTAFKSNNPVFVIVGGSACCMESDWGQVMQNCSR